MSQPKNEPHHDLTDEQRQVYDALRAHLREIDRRYDAVNLEMESLADEGRLDPRLRAILRRALLHLAEDVKILARHL